MDGYVKVTLVKSMIGRPVKHRKTLRCMGLTKIGKSITSKETASFMGMVKTVQHLVKVEAA